MSTEISHTKHKVYITCLEMDTAKKAHVNELWKKQAERILEQSAGKEGELQTEVTVQPFEQYPKR